ncbi:MAG TPA: hypothetical protein VLH13_00165, partial [Methanomassiliicoccales archaeon]|nr:hypothetical protein [Methanomassiliicoccales archaeon]
VDQDGAADELLLRYDQRYGGKYWWRFPSSGWSKIGFPAGTEAPPSDHKEKHARIIPIGRVPELVKGNCALVGDAAGQANPLTFGGLRASFQAAMMLANAIRNDDLASYERAWSCSDMANPCFLESFDLIRSMTNHQLSCLARPLRYGPNMTAVMDGLLNQEGFGIFYRGHVRKLSAGW